eukprot:5336722-Pleurochrysis_carterae.AAC.1
MLPGAVQACEYLCALADLAAAKEHLPCGWRACSSWNVGLAGQYRRDCKIELIRVLGEPGDHQQKQSELGRGQQIRC